MSETPLSEDEQNSIVQTMMVNIETLSEEEIDALYAKLDSDHRREADDNIRAFANNAVGDDSWDH